MRVGAFRPDKMAFSFRNYSDHVVRQLRVMGADIITFRRDVSLPAAIDLFWDPRVAGGNPTYRPLLRAATLCVASVHGEALIILPSHELHTQYRRRLDDYLALFKDAESDLLPQVVHDRIGIQAKIGKRV